VHLKRSGTRLITYRKKNGQPLNVRTQFGPLTPIRAPFKYLVKQRVLVNNPASELELPRIGHRLPRAVLTPVETELVLAQADVSDLLGLRDRAIMEVLYSTGLRRAEAAGLSIHDVDFERGTVLVRAGKGNRDRMVAIGERALGWVDKYLRDVRPELVVPPDDKTLFLNNLGRAIGLHYLSQLVGRYVEAADIGKRGACHALRHSMATQMHDNGADIRHIQAQLGHAELNTTAIYTRVSIRKLKDVHDTTHPASKTKRSKQGPAKS
jgi:integrase/recombinase XerD